MEHLATQTVSTPLFTLKGLATRAKIVKVYDGDTVHAVLEVFGKCHRFVCRIAHVDAPELRTKDENEKKRGYEVKSKVSELLLDKIFDIHCCEFDKYGRLLIELTLPSGEKLHNWLIANEYAKSYEGGTKEKWDELSSRGCS